MSGNRWRIRTKWLAGIVLILALTLLASGSTFTQAPAPQYPLGDIPLDPVTYQMHLRVYPEAAIEALDPAYDARDYEIVTPAKDQANCGSCWAFASVGAMESHLLKQYGFGPTDLSEQQQVSCNTSMLGCRGGSSTAIRYWETKGPLDEPCFPYTADDRTPCAEDNCAQFPYRVVNFHTVPVATDQFKSSLYNDGPSYWRYDVYSDFYTYWNYGSPGQVYVNQGGSLQGGHAVLLIGWDDAKGAYLCKNSWGENGGPNGDGTFWIAYSGHYHNLGFGMANFGLTSLGGCNNNGECEEGEDCSTCPADCPSGQGGGTCVTCFKGVCDGVCHPVKEDSTCKDCAPSFCCGNGTCESGEDGLSCEVDCGAPPVCGNGTCDPEETQCNCASDCDLPPADEVGLCGNGIDDDCDGYIDCDDSDCTDTLECQCLPKGASCTLDGDCCSNKCRGGKCR